MDQENLNNNENTGISQNEDIDQLSENGNTKKQEENGEKHAHYVFKISFNETHGEFNGAMVLMGDTQESGFSSVDVVMDKVFSLSLDQDWNSYLDFIKKKRKDVQDSGSNFLIFIRKIESYFKKSISNTKIDKINKIIITTEDEMLRNVLIKNILEGEISSLIAHGFEIELILKDEIQYYMKEVKNTQGNSDGSGDGMANPQSSANEMILDAIPMIDPNEGIKASEISEGDRIFVRITDDSVVGKHIARSITKNENPEEIPVRTPVFSVRKNVISKFRASSEVMEIMVKLDDGVFGKIVVQTEVRLRTRLEDEKENAKKEEIPSEYMEADSAAFFPYILLIGSVFLILYLIIRFLGN